MSSEFALIIPSDTALQCVYYGSYTLLRWLYSSHKSALSPSPSYFESRLDLFSLYPTNIYVHTKKTTLIHPNIDWSNHWLNHWFSHHSSNLLIWPSMGLLFFLLDNTDGELIQFEFNLGKIRFLQIRQIKYCCLGNLLQFVATESVL